MAPPVQEAPQAPSYAAAGIQVPAASATPEAAMNSVKDQQSQLNSVNNLTGGRRNRTQRKGRKHRRQTHKSFIRTYKGRRYNSEDPQKGGAQEGGQIAVPQVGSTCSSGPQCSGAQNANFTAINNQAQSSSINDAYAQKGGRRHKKVRFSHGHRHGSHGSHSHTHSRKTRHDQSLTTMIAYNIKKVLRKVFA